MAENAPLTETAKNVQSWIDEINQAEQACQPWWRSGDVIIRRYKNDERNGKGNENATLTRRRRYAILYSNVQTLQPAIYANPPQPVVMRRFKDEDAVAKVASDVLERAISYSIDQYEFDGRLKSCRDDYLLPGRGQVWVRYVPHMRTVNPKQDIDLDEGQEDEDQAEPQEELEYEEVLCDHVAWKDFLTNQAREWAEVRWVSRRVFMTRAELVARFGAEIGKEVPLDWEPKGAETDDDERKNEAIKRAQVYELWDKVSKTAYWISKGHTSGFLDKRKDPLNLRGFFPCPPPLQTTTAPDSYLPIADYIQYQDQAEELDDLTGRIGKLQEALRMVGVYAGSENVLLTRIFSPGNENKLIPVDTYDIFKDKGGVKGVIEWVPIDMVVQCLQGCYEARAQVISDIYQITGISDIIRGEGDANETATAQRIKGQWGSLRVRDRQKEMQRFARDIIRLKAEIIAEHFSIDTLKAMTNVKLLTDAEKQQMQLVMQQLQMAQQAGLPLPPGIQQPTPEQMELMKQPTWEEVKALLTNDALRSFRIDIETDSTVEPDETAQKEAYTEFVNAATALLTAAASIVPSEPRTAPLFAEFLKEGARIFRTSRSMEDTIDRVFGQFEEQPPAPPQGEQPQQSDPNALMAEQIKGQTAMVQAQNEAQRTEVDAQLGMAEIDLKRQELQLKAAALASDPTPQGTA